jgi:ABC-type lipoprotein export system ATPase subunit
VSASTRKKNNFTVTSDNLISLRRVTKSYVVEERTVHALQSVDLDVRRGEFLVIVGRSGCGKSTLLNLMGGIDKPSSGEVLVAGKESGVGDAPGSHATTALWRQWKNAAG